MTREECSRLGLFQIVRYNVSVEDFKDDAEHEWLIPYCGKLAIVTQKIIWNNDRDGEEIHLRFPRKGFGLDNVFYSSIEELQEDFANGRDISFNEGFDTGAAEIDIVSTVNKEVQIQPKKKQIKNKPDWTEDEQYMGTCVQCRHYHDYGCMVSHLCSVDGKCNVDGHEIPGALVKCSINKFEHKN